MRFPKQITLFRNRNLTRSKSKAMFFTIIASCAILTILSPTAIPPSIRRKLELFEPTMVMVMKPIRPIPTWILDGGVVFPIVATNTHGLSIEQTEAAVLRSLSVGIRNIDFHLGGNERDGVAAALTRIDREDLFLVTKIDVPLPEEEEDDDDTAATMDTEAAAKLVRDTVETEYSILGIEYIDVLLLNESSDCAILQAQWAELEHLLSEGRVRALGTYNFTPSSIDCILETAIVPPTLNYLMRHVGMGPDRTQVIQYGESKGIRTVTYGTLGEPIALPDLLTDRTVSDIAQRHGRSVEEVALRWNVQWGYAVSNRPSADYAPDNNTPYGMMVCHGDGSGSGETNDDDCGSALVAMRTVGNWELTRAEMAALDGVRLEKWGQNPTYYSNAGREDSFGVVKYPTESCCGVVKTEWCGNLSIEEENGEQIEEGEELEEDGVEEFREKRVTVPIVIGSTLSEDSLMPPPPSLLSQRRLQ